MEGVKEAEEKVHEKTIEEQSPPSLVKRKRAKDDVTEIGTSPKTRSRSSPLASTTSTTSQTSTAVKSSNRGRSSGARSGGSRKKKADSGGASKSTSGEPWSNEEDKILVDSIMGLMPTIPWAVIAEKLPNRNVKSLQNRWGLLKKRLNG
ncbi:4261_t:CDS:2 [Acaulospora morrowiae]|uniref:4261_t:CDS:1 n=1 Tax=Acaulospora morrowiae TaxID=94023 RepID=A0A9N8VM66_9GLOM|nr:4261_t:CDS:2 [Acaulospora morrowiae]